MYLFTFMNILSMMCLLSGSWRALFEVYSNQSIFDVLCVEKKHVNALAEYMIINKNFI